MQKRIEDGGKLQALQVIIDGSPIHAADAVGDITRCNASCTPGTSWPIKWVTVTRQTRMIRPAPCSMQMPPPARAPAIQAAGEHGLAPGSGFRTFFFSPTGDRTRPRARFPTGGTPGGSIFRVDLGRDDDDQRITTVKPGKTARSRFSFSATRSTVRSITLPSPTSASCWPPDRGDLHDQLQKLDSVWAFDVKTGHAQPFIARPGPDRATRR
jgi:hypothetical protein